MISRVRLPRPGLVPAALFAASAAFVLWRNSEVGVLVDFAYIVNNATRVAQGDVPYADFPLAHPPLTFLAQAVVIRLFGPHYVALIAFAAIAGGLASALTHRVVFALLDGAVSRPRLVAAILCLPLVPLGIYAVLPNPFYDSDACLAVIVGLVAVLGARRSKGGTPAILAGALLPVPLFIKQNIGGAFLMLTLGALALEALARPALRRAFFGYSLGSALALALAALALQLSAGIDRYVAWTWTYALAGRGIVLEKLHPFVEPRTVWPAVLLLGLVLATRRAPPRIRVIAFLLALCAPLAAAIALPASAVAVPELWPPLLVAAGALALARAARDGVTFERVLPLVCGGTAVAAVLSQGLYGSTYGIFPLLSIAIASLVVDLGRFVDSPRTWIAPMTGAVLAVLLFVGGTVYTTSNARLRFIDVNAPGPVMRSSFPSLLGLSARGPYLADLDEILRWMSDNVPARDTFAFLPGEDPVYYALGRRPPLPSVYFYDVASPLPPREIALRAEAIGLRWVFVKERLQLSEQPPDEPELVSRLTSGLTRVGRVGVYTVYRREQ